MTHHHTPRDTRLALCAASAQADAPALAIALCMDVPDAGANGDLPEVVQIFPRGPGIQRVDGRQWWLNDLPAVVAAQNAVGDVPIDWDHATEIAAPQGQPAPAAGWLRDWHDCGGALCARVTWTPRGAEAVRNREHRYLTPAFLHDGAGLQLSPGEMPGKGRYAARGRGQSSSFN